MKRYRDFVLYLISYLVVLLIPILLVSYFLYATLTDNMEKEASLSAKHSLVMARDSVDGIIYGYRKTAAEVSVSADLSSLLHVDDISVFEGYPHIVNAINELNQYKNMNSITSDVFLYLRGSGVVLTSTTRMDEALFFKVFSVAGLSAKGLKEVLEEAGGETLISDTSIYYATRRFDGFLYINTVPSSDSLLIIPMEGAAVREYLQNAVQDYGGISFILDENNEVMAEYTSPDADITVDDQLKLVESGKLDADAVYMDGHVISNCVVSPVNGWRYISTLPTENVFSELYRIRDRTILLFAVALAAGLLLAYYFSSKNYRKLQGISVILSKYRASGEQGAGESKSINQIVGDYITEHDSMKDRIVKQLPIIKHSFFSRLLRGELTEEPAIEEMKILLGVRDPGLFYTVMAAELSAPAEDAQEGPPPLTELAKATFVGLIDQLTEGCPFHYILEDTPGAFFIIVGESAEAPKKMTELGAEIRDIVNERLKMGITVGIGRPYQALSSLHRSEEEAVRAAEYKLIMGSNSVIGFDGIASRQQSKLCYTYSQERAIMDSLKMADFGQIERILDEILDRMKQNASSVEAVRCVYYDLFNTVVRAADEINVRTDNLSKLQGELPGIRTMEQMHTKVREIYREICDTIRESKGSKNVRLRNDIIGYIESHYRDGALSMESLADEFLVSPSYLSRFIKDQTGYTVTDCIHRLRLSHAKKLLRESDLTVAEIGERVGYNSLQNFSRVFKRYENLSPSEYRGMLRHGGQETG